MHGARLGTDVQDSPAASAWLPLLLALLIGLDRFVALGRWSLWIDEVLTFDDYTRHIGFEHVGYPIGFWAIGATVRLLGGTPDEFTLRLLPAVAGFACIPLTWWTFRPLAGSRAAAFAALLLAASPWALFWSQNARFYTLALLVSLLGAGLVSRGLTSGGRARCLVGLILCASACLLQPSALLLAGALAFAPTIVSASRLARPGFAPGAVRSLLVFLVLGLAAGLLWSLETWRSHIALQPSPSLLHFVKSSGFYLGPVLLTGALLGAWGSIRRRDAGGVLAVVVCVLTLSCLTLLSFTGGVTAQYAFVLLPWVALLASRPVQDLSPVTGWAYIALLLAPALTDSGLYFATWQGNRPRWREAIQTVLQQSGEGDVLLTNAVNVGKYYVERRPPGTPELRVEPISRWEAATAPDALPSGSRAWFVFRPDRGRYSDPEGRTSFYEFLRARGRFVARELLVPFAGRDLSIDVFVVEGG